MNRPGRIILLFATTGLVWYYTLQLLFVCSGAQNILSNPKYQNSKFIKAFIDNPLPRMAEPGFAVKGFLITGIFEAMAFLLVNNKLNGNWIKKGLFFGSIQWLVMIPWFELYLPYNVMLEPLPLVLLESVLWAGVTTIMGLWMSLVMNCSFNKRNL